jgi:hypothetical protein
MVEFLKLIGELIGNILGLTLETAGELAGRYLSFIRRAAILWGIALLVSCGFYWLGYHENEGLFFAVGTGLISIATLAWIVVLTPVWAGVQKLAEKSPIFAQMRNMIITLTLGFSFITIYIPLSHAWKNSNLFPILLALTAFLTLMAVLTGKSLNPDTLVLRAKILLFVVSILILANAVLPEEVTTRVQPLLKHTVSLEPKLISCLDSDFFESASTTPQPKVWFYLTEKGEYECYNNPGFHPKTGQRLVPINPETAKIILRRQQEERKKHDKQVVVNKLKPEKPKIQEPQKIKTETNEQKPVSQKQPEPESNPVIVKPVTLDVATTESFSTESSKMYDIVEVVLAEPISVSSGNGKSFKFDKGLKIRMKITGLQPAEGGAKPEIILTPFQVILSDEERLDISGDPVAIKPSGKKEFLKGLGKTLIGTGIGAGLGAISDGKSGAQKGALAGTAIGATVAVITRGKHIEVPAGYRVKIDGVKII